MFLAVLFRGFLDAYPVLVATVFARRKSNKNTTIPGVPKASSFWRETGTYWEMRNVVQTDASGSLLIYGLQQPSIPRPKHVDLCPSAPSKHNAIEPLNVRSKSATCLETPEISCCFRNLCRVVLFRKPFLRAPSAKNVQSWGTAAQRASPSRA